MKKIILFFLLCSILTSGTAFAAEIPGDWWGKVTIEGMENTDGTMITAHLNNNSEPVATTTVGKQKANYYLIHVPGDEGYNVTFKVNGMQVEQSKQEWSKGDHERLDLNVKMPEENHYSNKSFDIEANKTVSIDAKNQTQTTLKMRSKKSLENASVSLVKYSKNPGRSKSGSVDLKKYVGIETSQDIEENLSWSIVEVSYTQGEISKAGVSEGSLELHYFNETSDKWESSSGSTVNKDENIVSTNTTHFSIWNLFGSSSSEDKEDKDSGNGGGSGGTGGGMGGMTCQENWTCSEWSGCIDDTQTRNCTDLNECGTTEGKPKTSRSCEVEKCTPNWECTEWSKCINGTQTKECRDLNECGTTEGKPSEEQSCEVEEESESTQTTGITGRILGNPLSVIAGIVLLILVVIGGIYWKSEK